MHSIFITVLPLDATKLQNIISEFADIRTEVLGTSGSVGSLAIALGGILCAILLLKFSYDFMAGNQLDLWTVAKPVAILIAVANFAPIISYGDAVLDWLTVGLRDSFEVDMDASRKEVQTIMQGIAAKKRQTKGTWDYCLSAPGTTGFSSALAQTAASASDRAAIAKADAALENGSAGAGKIDFTDISSGWKKLTGIDAVTSPLAPGLNAETPAASTSVGAAAATSAIEDDLKAEGYIRENGDQLDHIEDELSEYYGTTEPRSGGMGFWVSIVCWLNDHLYILLECMAELSLIVLSVIGPFVFILAMFPKWSGGIWAFVSRYIQLSFWKVCAAAVTWVTLRIRGLIYVQQYADLQAGTATEGLGSIVFWTGLAGIFAMFAVPTIASWLVDGASAADAGSALKTMGAAAAGALAASKGAAVGGFENMARGTGSNAGKFFAGAGRNLIGLSPLSRTTKADLAQDTRLGDIESRLHALDGKTPVSASSGSGGTPSSPGTPETPPTPSGASGAGTGADGGTKGGNPAKPSHKRKKPSHKLKKRKFS